MMSRFVLVAVLVSACGRSALKDEEQLPPPAAEQPLYVFTGALCPARGTEQDLKPDRYDGLALVRFRAVQECSGAGGEWLVGRQVDSSRDYFVGAHACSFLPPDMREAKTEYFGVLRYSQTAALFKTPEGWCISDADGRAPVTTDSKSIAWGVYRTEAGARAALARLQSQQ